MSMDDPYFDKIKSLEGTIRWPNRKNETITDEKYYQNCKLSKHVEFYNRSEFTKMHNEIHYFVEADKYFKNISPFKIYTMINIINKQSRINSGLIKFFINYITDNEEENDDEKNIIKSSHQLQVKIYKMKYFDIFRRYKRFKYTICDKTICTTLGQLNFFKWLFKENVFQCIEKNFDDILDKMTKKIIPVYKCLTCDNQITKNGTGLCNVCFRKKTGNIIKPMYEKLKKEIDMNGYDITSKKYNISDKTIKQWVKYFQSYDNDVSS
jgi:hypothetical protein